MLVSHALWGQLESWGQEGHCPKSYHGSVAGSTIRQISFMYRLIKVISEFYAFTWGGNGTGCVDSDLVLDVKLAISLQL